MEAVPLSPSAVQVTIPAPDTARQRQPAESASASALVAFLLECLRPRVKEVDANPVFTAAAAPAASPPPETAVSLHSA